MNRYISILLVFFGGLFAGETDLDIVTLKNGSVLKGIITERDSLDNLTIVLPGGVSVDCKSENVQAIGKEGSGVKKTLADQMLARDKKSSMKFDQYDFESDRAINYEDYNNSHNCDRKDPVVAFALSLLLCGLGQHYNGETGKGLILNASMAAGYIIFQSSDYENTMGIVIMAVSELFSIIDAPASANRINNEYGKRTEFNIGTNTVALYIEPEKDGASLKLSYEF